MSISQRYESGEQKSNIAHFSVMVNLAQVDGSITREEEIVLGRLAIKLNVSDEDHKAILKKPNLYPSIGILSLEERIERMLDLFSVIYVDYTVDTAEEKLIFKYAIALGFTEKSATEEIEKCKRKFDQASEFED